MVYQYKEMSPAKLLFFILGLACASATIPLLPRKILRSLHKFHRVGSRFTHQDEHYHHFHPHPLLQGGHYGTPYASYPPLLPHPILSEGHGNFHPHGIYSGGKLEHGPLSSFGPYAPGFLGYGSLSAPGIFNGGKLHNDDYWNLPFPPLPWAGHD